MHQWSYVRREARARRREVCEHARATAPDLALMDLSAAQLLQFAEEVTGLVRVPLPAGDPLLYGAQATLDDGFIYFNAEIEAWLALYHQAHEFAHHWLHRQTSLCSSADVDYTETEERPQHGAARVEAYGPAEHRETEANVFAREFLLPGDMLRRMFVEEKLNARQIAARTGLNLDFVLHALANALLAPDVEAATDEEASDEAETSHTSSDEQRAAPSPPALALDESQRAAAESAHTPLLVAAGPGTGKTRALVGRVLHLIESGVAPRSILALTFSNKAAAEMRERVSAHAPQAAAQIETGTFHSFGLELLRRYWKEAGLPPRPRVLDPVDALFILERHLPAIRLDQFQNLHEPTKHLPAILNAISRAKDELCAPERYRELARRMLTRARAANDKELLRLAERAAEVARVYEFYQAHLEREGLLDFGDLVSRAVRLLRDSDAVRDVVRARFRHVLVDEYQDVNRACGVLLSLIAKDGAGLWVVGDVRQAVYRWRGAAPAQVKFFRRDFPAGRVLPLKVNYRSLPAIVGAVSTFAAKMSVTASSDQVAADDFAAWESHRRHDAPATDATHTLRYEVGTDAEAEARGLARLIEERRAAGAAYKSQAVICRTHAQLARVAKGLEAEGVPALYLGDLFERSEVRDLLALLALACDPSRRTLLRVARFPEYSMPLTEVRAALRAAREAHVAADVAQRDATFNPPAIALRPRVNGEALSGGELLESHLASVARFASPFKFLARYLFIDSRYLASLAADDSVAGRQRRAAIYQLLQFAHAEERRAVLATNEEDARRALLGYVRRLKTFAEDKALRQTSVAEEFDAVHLVTVHGAKGLEWEHVYLPYLGKGHFPARRQADVCPPPRGMIDSLAADCDDERDAHREEEQCLFFVALSRARDTLCLSRGATYGKQNSNASAFLEAIAAHLPREVTSRPTWRDERATAPLTRTLFAMPPRADYHFTERELRNYIKCPRKYFYENLLYLSGRVEETAYVRFHACVYEVLRRLAEEKAAGRLQSSKSAAAGEARRLLTKVWREADLTSHVYEPIYREQAELMIERAAHRIFQARGEIILREWTLTRPRGSISVNPDHVELIKDAGETSLLIMHTRTGRPPAKVPDDPLYGLYYALAAEHFPAARLNVSVFYLSTGETISLDLSPRTIAARLKHYDDAIDSIIAGEFPHAPDAHTCPRCAHLFTCPKGEDSGAR